MRILLIVCFLIWNLHAYATKTGQPIKVDVKKVSETTHESWKALYGRFLAGNASVVHNVTDSIITKVLINEGDTIKINQPIFEIKPIRDGRVFKSRSIKSNMTGVVGHIFVSKGEIVKFDSPLLKIFDSYSDRVKVWVPSNEAEQLKRSASTKLRTFASDSETWINAKFLNFTESDGNALSAILKIDCRKASCTNSLVNSLVEVKYLESSENMILVDSDDLRFGREKALVVVRGKAKWIDVKSGKQVGEKIQVVSGLKPGDQIISNFEVKPEDGEPVLIRNKESLSH